MLLAGRARGVLLRLSFDTAIGLLPPLLSPSAGGCDCTVSVRQPHWLIQVGINAGPGVHAMDPGFCGGAHSLLVGSYPCMYRLLLEYSDGFCERSRPRARFPGSTNTALHGITKHVRLVRTTDATMPQSEQGYYVLCIGLATVGLARVWTQPRDGGDGSRAGVYRLLAFGRIRLPSRANKLVPWRYTWVSGNTCCRRPNAVAEDRPHTRFLMRARPPQCRPMQELGVIARWTWRKWRATSVLPDTHATSVPSTTRAS
jgi:hypothetical protein